MATRDLSAWGYRRIVLLLVGLVIVPTVLLLLVGVVLLFLGEAKLNLLMGILVMALSGAAVTGVILVWVFVRREAYLSRLQADFVSKVSHEFRTPLTSIRLYAETLSMRRGDRQAEDKCIDALGRETLRLQALIDRLLDWGKMESGRREYTMTETSVREIVEEALDAFDPLREQTSTELSVLLPEEELTVNADAGAMTDALFNLLTNAQKYGGRPPRVQVVVTGRGKTVAIGVLDNGSGIQKRERKRIFQKFYRVDDRLSREREGSGLGLAIVKHVMKAHGGQVELQAAPGGGSSFSLILPRKRPA